MFKNTIRTSFIFLLSLFALSAAAQTSEEVEERVKKDVMERYPDIEEYTLQNQLVRVLAEFKRNDTSYTMTYSSKGKWQHTIYEIDPADVPRSEEHTSELQSLMRNSYADFCLKKKI